MLNLVIGFAFIAMFIVLLWFTRARNGVPVLTSVWAAQGVALALVCVLMVAGGFLFKSMVG